MFHPRGKLRGEVLFRQQTYGAVGRQYSLQINCKTEWSRGQTARPENHSKFLLHGLVRLFSLAVPCQCGEEFLLPWNA